MLPSHIRSIQLFTFCRVGLYTYNCILESSTTTTYLYTKSETYSTSSTPVAAAASLSLYEKPIQFCCCLPHWPSWRSVAAAAQARATPPQWNKVSPHLGLSSLTTQSLSLVVSELINSHGCKYVLTLRPYLTFLQMRLFLNITTLKCNSVNLIIAG